MKWRRWFRIIHGDFGYLFFGVTVIYAVSGIALNHLDDWNPNFAIHTEQIFVEDPSLFTKKVSKENVISFLDDYDLDVRYKNHYFPSDHIMKIFLKEGSVILNTDTGEGLVEILRRRPFVSESNYLHYNPIRYWTYFSDLFCVALFVLAVTGLFLIKGRKGITGRGAWLTILGILIPLGYLLLYFY